MMTFGNGSGENTGPMRELCRTSLRIDQPPAELRFILIAADDSRWLKLEVHPLGGSPQAEAPVRRLTIPLSLWPRFYQAVCCLGAFMKPLPAPAYQATACCTYTCPPAPDPVVLGQGSREQLHLTLQDRRGSTFLEIKAGQDAVAETNSVEAQTIRIGPTLWSAFLAAVQRLNDIIADL
jgi:hypothetical protein